MTEPVAVINPERVRLPQVKTTATSPTTLKPEEEIATTIKNVELVSAQKDGDLQNS